MSLIAPALPQVGQPRGSEETDILNALQTIVNAINGGLDAANLANGAVTLAKVASDVVPVGEIRAYGGSAAPSGWLLCFGQAISRTTYSALFNALGTAYGPGDGSTTFNLPDLRGRTPIGADDLGGSAAGRVTGAVRGAAGGEQTHLLTGAESGVKAHSHNPSGVGSATGFAIGSVGAGTHTIAANPGGNIAVGDIANAAAANASNAHNNLQPYLAIAYMIRTGI